MKSSIIIITAADIFLYMISSLNLLHYYIKNELSL